MSGLFSSLPPVPFVNLEVRIDTNLVHGELYFSQETSSGVRLIKDEDQWMLTFANELKINLNDDNAIEMLSLTSLEESLSRLDFPTEESDTKEDHIETAAAIYGNSLISHKDRDKSLSFS